MKIYLIGVGGVGGFYGGKIAMSGADITLVARGESFVVIKRDGLILDTADGVQRIQPKIIEHISEIINPDVIILAVKSHSLREVCRELKSVVLPETTVITLQNGLENDLVVSSFLNCEVLPGLVLVAATKTHPNKIVQKGLQRKLVFGRRDGVITEKMKEIESIFNSAEIEARVTSDIYRELWKKFLFVVSFASATVWGRCPIGEALNNPGSLRVYKEVLREAIEIGKKEGVIFDLDIFESTLTGALSFDPTAKSSMLVDLENARKTEVEALQGVVMKLAKKYGLSVPTTRMVYERVTI